MRQGTKTFASYFFMLLLFAAQLEMAFHGLAHHHADAQPHHHHHCTHGETLAAEEGLSANADYTVDAPEESCLRCGQFLVHSKAISPQGLHCTIAFQWAGATCMPHTEWVADLGAQPTPRGPPAA